MFLQVKYQMSALPMHTWTRSSFRTCSITSPLGHGRYQHLSNTRTTPAVLVECKCFGTPTTTMFRRRIVRACSCRVWSAIAGGLFRRRCYLRRYCWISYAQHCALRCSFAASAEKTPQVSEHIRRRTLGTIPLWIRYILGGRVRT